MAQEILDALKREGFVDCNANEVSFLLFDVTGLKVWAHNTRLVVHLYNAEMYDDVYLPSLSSNKASLENVIGIVQLKNLLHVPDEAAEWVSTDAPF